MNRPLLSLDRVERTFSGGRHAVRAVQGVSMSIEPRICFALVGESGSGKSTIANMVVGSDAPTGGAILLDGVSLTADRSLAQRRRIGFVQQNPYAALNPRRTVAASIDLPLLIHGYPPAQRRQRIAELLDLVGLPAEIAHRNPRTLSGGQRQRIAIARAIAAEPQLVVLDEPTSALDVSVQARVLALLADLQTRLGLTYLLITHDLGVVRALSQRVGVLYRGRLVEESAAEALFRSPRHPYSRLLLSSVPTVDPDDDAFKPRWPDGAPAESLPVADGCDFHARCPYALDRCAGEQPELATVSSEHRAACFAPVGASAAAA